METYEARLASFQPAPRKRNQPKQRAAWPHPKSFSVTPESLAAAGFYYDPQALDDNATCVYCKRGLEGWEAGDDALDEHLKRTVEGTGEKCSWAVMMQVKRDHDAAGGKACEDPASQRMHIARLGTFGNWWVLDGKPGWKPTSERLAAAGFYNRPQQDALDTCACCYCDAQLGEWEKDDDPEYEHRRRNPDCFFFTSQQSTSKGKKAPAKGRTTTSRASSAVVLEKVDPVASAPKAKRKAISRTTTQESVQEESEAASEPESQKPARPLTKAKAKGTTAKAKAPATRRSKAPSVIDIESDAESVAESNVELEEDAVDNQPSYPKEIIPAKSTRSHKSTAPRHREGLMDQEEATAEAVLSSKPKKSGKGRTKAKATETEELGIVKVGAVKPKKSFKARKGTLRHDKKGSDDDNVTANASQSELDSAVERQAEESTADIETEGEGTDLPTPKATAALRSSKTSTASARTRSERSGPKRAVSTASSKIAPVASRTRSGSQSSVISLAGSAIPAEESIAESERSSEDEDQSAKLQPGKSQSSEAMKRDEEQGNDGGRVKGKGKAVASEPEPTNANNTDQPDESEAADQQSGMVMDGRIEVDLQSYDSELPSPPAPAPAPASRPYKAIPKRKSSPRPSANIPSISHSKQSLSASLLPTVLPPVHRSQSALDALLAEPMPIFDSPEKQALTKRTSNSTTSSSAASVSEAPTPDPDDRNEHARTANTFIYKPDDLDLPLIPEALSEAEGRMPVLDWVHMLCEKEVKHFEAEGMRMLDEWDRQTARRRLELLSVLDDDAA